MKITCVGGGPAGLYFAISMKLRDRDHDITVIERDPPGATYGWGVTYTEDLVDLLHHNDPKSTRAMRAASVFWQEHEVTLRGEETAFVGGYGFCMNRATLLELLAERATELGVDVQHRREVTDPAQFAGCDLVVAADGANSRTRSMLGDHFGTRIDYGANPYIWLGTDKVFDKFAFAFEETPAGWIWFYGYPSSAEISTCIVECGPETWRGLGFDSMSNEDCVRMLEKIFVRPLDGRSLISQSRDKPAEWLLFGEVRNERWYHDNMVLAGDAAHTTHFTLGSGTTLAMIDAFELSESLSQHDRLVDGLADYDRRGRAAMRWIQDDSRTSMAWFEHPERHLDGDAVAFSYALSRRADRPSPWRYLLHRANQHPAVRGMHRALNSRMRRALARRRGGPVPPAGANAAGNGSARANATGANAAGNGSARADATGNGSTGERRAGARPPV
jgi:2-polyprenyl-6-methoxyphenol hydroxylase-like FAD-dependent oxidoreductase